MSEIRYKLSALISQESLDELCESKNNKGKIICIKL